MLLREIPSYLSNKLYISHGKEIKKYNAIGNKVASTMKNRLNNERI